MLLLQLKPKLGLGLYIAGL